MSNDLACPTCGEALGGNLGRVPAFVDEERVRLAIDCSGCSASVELTTSDAVGVSTIEARRGHVRA